MQRPIKYYGDQILRMKGAEKTRFNDELKALIKENGGSPSSSVTPNTFLILAGSKMGPKKKVLADKLGVKITNINNFIDEYINKKEDENLKNEINFIDIFFPEKAQKKTVSKKKLKTEAKKALESPLQLGGLAKLRQMDLPHTAGDDIYFVHLKAYRHIEHLKHIPMPSSLAGRMALQN